MKYETFKRFLDSYRKGENMMSELHSIGIDFYEGKYKISEILYDQLISFLSSHYDEEGVEWVSWFIFENEYGEKDWSTVKSMDGTKGQKYGAFDEGGNPIFYSHESAWDYLEKYHRIKEENG